MAHWFDIATLVEAWEQAGSKKSFELPEPLRVSGHEDKLKVNGNNLQYILAVHNKSYLDVVVKDGGKKMVYGPSF